MSEMSADARKQNGKRLILYLGINFGITWLFEFLVIWPAVFNPRPLVQSITQLLLAVVMFFPALSVLLTRLITREGFKDAMLAPKTGKRSIPYFLMAWFGPQLLTTAGAVIYFLVFPRHFDPDMGYLAALLAQQGVEPTNQLITATVISQLGAGIFLAPALNFIPCFGEEWGWRGYLLPKLKKQWRLLPTLLISGLIWGVWHLPIIMLGHNYGTGYMGYPITGILAMCVFCVVTGTIFSYLTIRTGSCLPAVLAHGGLNGFASAGLLFANINENISPFVGPVPTGIVGGSAYIICAVVMGLLLLRKENAAAERS